MDLVYYVQKSLLATVSQELVAHCTSGFRAFPGIVSLRLFLGWLFGITVNIRDQKAMVQAWIFGARFKIPIFQNAVMRQLVNTLHEEDPDEAAISEAYTHPDSHTHGDLVRKAFIAQLCYELRCTGGSLENLWINNAVAKSLCENTQFSQDLASAVCFGTDVVDYDEGGLGGLNVECLLVQG